MKVSNKNLQEVQRLKAEALGEQLGKAFAESTKKYKSISIQDKNDWIYRNILLPAVPTAQRLVKAASFLGNILDLGGSVWGPLGKAKIK